MSNCYRATPHVRHEWIPDPSKSDEISICPGILRPGWMQQDLMPEAIDNVPIGMAGQTVSLGLPGMPGQTVELRRDDCHLTTSHTSHTWVLGDNDEGEEETVFCLGLDAKGRRPDQLTSHICEPKYIPVASGCSCGEPMADEDSKPDPDLETASAEITIDGTFLVEGDSLLVPGDAQNGVYEIAQRMDEVSIFPKYDPESTHNFASTIHPPINPDGPETTREEATAEFASGAIQRWADTAMYKAEEIDATDGPRVYLLWMTPDPLGAIAAACKMYKGEVVRDLSTVTDAERLEYFEQVQRTKLKAPFEFVKFHFLIEGVTRAFTHQMVRQRTAAYAQESLRFAIKEDMPVGLPPSLAGTTDPGDPSFPDVPSANEERMRAEWNVAINYVGDSYRKLVDMGMPAEDARGLLPHNVLTRLHYTTDLRAILDHAGNRLCTQAQFEWRLVFAKIIDAIRGIGADRGAGFALGPKACNGSESAYMADELLLAFRPVCFQTGRCEFKADFDRHCSIRERVDEYERHGIGSNQWEHGVNYGQNPDQPPLVIDPIKPGEWLLDPGAARKK